MTVSPLTQSDDLENEQFYHIGHMYLDNSLGLYGSSSVCCKRENDMILHDTASVCCPFTSGVLSKPYGTVECYQNLFSFLKYLQNLRFLSLHVIVFIINPIILILFHIIVIIIIIIFWTYK